MNHVEKAEAIKQKLMELHNLQITIADEMAAIAIAEGWRDLHGEILVESSKPPLRKLLREISFRLPTPVESSTLTVDGVPVEGVYINSSEAEFFPVEQESGSDEKSPH